MGSDELRSRGSNTAPADHGPRSPVLIGWFARLSWAGRIMVLGGLLLVLICVLFAEENWRGRRAWEICRRELDAKGALDWRKFIPEPVADDQNFAATPFLAPLFDFNPKPRTPGQSPWRDVDAHDRAMQFAGALLPANKKGELPPSRFDAHLTDLEAPLIAIRAQANRESASNPTFSSRAEAAKALLSALEEYRPVLEELRSASQRPAARFNVDYDVDDPASILLPHYRVFQHVSRLLEVRASAELALGETEAAFQDLLFMFRLADSIKDEPFMIGAAVRGSLTKRTEQIIWEGLAGRNWSDAQLQGFEEQLKRFRPFKDMYYGLNAERAAFGGRSFDYIRSHKNALRMWLGSNEAQPLVYLLAGPEGWLFQEQVSYHRLYDERVLAGFDPDTGHIQPHVIDANQKALQQELTGPAIWHHTGFSQIILSNIMKTFQRTAIGQDRANQVIAACALERYRLAFKKYPAAIDELVPRFVDTLPLDVCDGTPLKYRLMPDGQFLLYSVGWNEKDDGGTVVMKPDGKDTEPNQGDWVWPGYSQKSNES